jgi:hypothetical protein
MTKSNPRAGDRRPNKADFDAALRKALARSRTGGEDDLPCWCGPHGDEAQGTAAANANGKKAKSGSRSGGRQSVAAARESR